MDKGDKVLHLASLTGYYMLYCGGETYRVEDTVNRILSNYKMKNINAFSSPTVIICSCMDDDKSYNKVLRVNSRSANLDMMDKLNQLSRDSNNITIEEFEIRLNQIISEDKKDNKMNIIFAGMVAFGFTLFFGGNITEAGFAFLIGILIKSIMNYLQHKEVNGFVITTIASFIITIMSLILKNHSLIKSQDIVIIGTIMLLVPGLAITNAIRDFLSNDLVSGTTRAMEALIIAVFVAVGSGLALTVWIKMGGSL